MGRSPLPSTAAAHARGMTRQEAALLVVFTTPGAVLSFSLTGRAAVGTVAGAADGHAAGEALQHRGEHR